MYDVCQIKYFPVLDMLSGRLLLAYPSDNRETMIFADTWEI